MVRDMVEFAAFKTILSGQPQRKPCSVWGRSLPLAMLLALGLGLQAPAAAQAQQPQAQKPQAHKAGAAVDWRTIDWTALGVAALNRTAANAIASGAVTANAIAANAITANTIAADPLADTMAHALATPVTALDRLSSPAPLAYQALKLAVADAIPLPRATGPRLDAGLHFYGEAPQRDQIGSAYMIFEVADGKAIGGVYWPRSSFNCFEGRFQGNSLALRVDDPYGDEPYSHELALQETAIVAAGDGLESVELTLGIAGMHALDSANAADHDILAICKAEL